MQKSSTSTNRTRNVVDYLTQAILNKDFLSDSQLPPERELAEQLGVSRNGLREATKILQSRGLLSVEHGRGTIITGVTTVAVQQVFTNALHGRSDGLLKVLQVRLPLEIEIARLAARQRKPMHIKATRDLVDEMEESLDNLALYAELDVAFHQSLAQATGNEIFVVVLESLSGLLTEYRLTALRQSSSQLAQEHHESILAAIEKQDQDDAARLLRYHLETSQRETESVRRRSRE